MDFRAVYARIRARVLAIAQGQEGVHTCLPLPGCGHFAMEAAIRSFVPRGGRLLLPMTGQYAERIQKLATDCGRVVVPLVVGADLRTDPDAVEAALRGDPTISHLACVYSETSTGIVHDVPALARAAGRAGRRVIVDAVSAFGALPFDIGALPMVDSVSFTSNKCIEGLPGSSFTVVRIESLRPGMAESWSFDFGALYEHSVQTKGGSPRFTPAVGALMAFNVALDIFDAAGGQAARLERYTENARTLFEGVQHLGLRPTLPWAMQGPIVMNIDAPPDAAWDLQTFVDGLKRHGVVISNFFNTPHPSIRVGCIGAVSPEDMARAVDAMGAVLSEMRIQQRRVA